MNLLVATPGSKDRLTSAPNLPTAVLRHTLSELVKHFLLSVIAIEDKDLKIAKPIVRY